MRLFHFLGKFVKLVIVVAGVTGLTMVVIAFTRIPFDMHRRLGDQTGSCNFKPEVILMLGGAGMPSESNLMRLYYTARVSATFKNASVYIAHPLDTSVTLQMKSYLVQAGCDSARISFLLKGTSTREQAMEFIRMVPGIATRKIFIITSPENMYRTIKVFNKIGFGKVCGVSAYENAMFVDLKYSHKNVGGKEYVPDISANIDLRYNFWNYLKLEITCIREYVAICYYKLNGWI